MQDLAEVVWSAKPPTWERLQQISSPVFCGPPSLRPVFGRALRLSVAHGFTTTRSLVRAPIRDVLSFMIWLDTARAFGIDKVVTPERGAIPMASALRTNRDGELRSGLAENIAAVVIAQNEEDLIETALSGVRPYVQEVVVVDGGSTDRTVDLATQMGAQVVTRQFDGDFSAQRNFGAAHAKAPWILAIDADERIGPELGGLLKEITRIDWADSVFTPRLNLHIDVSDTPVTWPDMQLRLFRRHLRFAGPIHEQVVGWSRPVFTPISGPFLEHRKTRVRSYRRSLYYATLDPTTYSDEWLRWASAEIERLESDDAVRDSGNDQAPEVR